MDNDKNIKNQENESETEKVSEPTAVVQPIVEEEPGDSKEPSSSSESSDSNDSSESSSSSESGSSSESSSSGESSTQDETESDRHLKEAIAEQAREDERPHSANFTLGKILGGDILTAQMFRNNIGLILLIVGFMVVYITNRYKVQKDLLEIDKLNTELDDAKYRALSSSSNLTEKSRESHVLESLQNSPDSALKQSDRPPYIIEVPDK